MKKGRGLPEGSWECCVGYNRGKIGITVTAQSKYFKERKTWTKIISDFHSPRER